MRQWGHTPRGCGQLRGTLGQDAGNRETAIYVGALISLSSHALLNIISAELHLKLNQHTSQVLPSPARYAPAMFVIITEQNKTHLQEMAYSIQTKRTGPDKMTFWNKFWGLKWSRVMTQAGYLLVCAANFTRNQKKISWSRQYEIFVSLHSVRQDVLNKPWHLERIIVT